MGKEAEFLFEATDPPSKRKLVAAALFLFARHGMHAVNVRAVAEQAGYTNPALFKFFESKEALALHLFERSYLELAKTLDQAVQRHQSFEENFHALLLAQDGFVVRHPEAWFFLHDHARELWPRASPVVKSRSSARLLRNLLEAGVRQGAVVGDLDLDLATAALMGAYQQFARARSLGGLPSSRPKLLTSLEALLLRMIAPTPTTPKRRRRPCDPNPSLG